MSLVQSRLSAELSPAPAAIVSQRPTPSVFAARPADFLQSSASDVDVLLRKWQACQRGSELPPFEEMALGSLGRISDYSALARRDADGRVEILRAGEKLIEIAGLTPPALSLSDASESMQLSLESVLAEATREREPAVTTHKSLVGGVIATVKLHALPLASRWAGDYYLVYVCTADRHTVLADLLIDSSHDGLLALSPIYRDGRVVDFHFLGCNERAAGFFATERDILKRERLSGVLSHCGCGDALTRFCTAFYTPGSQTTFELDFTTGLDRHMLQVSVVEADEVLSVTLTDIGELKSRETLFRSLFQDNAVPMVVRSADGLHVRKVNDAALTLLRMDEERFLREGLPGLSDEDVAAVRQAIRGSDGKPVEISGRIKAGGDELHTLEYAREIMVDGERAILSTIVDLTARKQAEERAIFLANHDPLTRLANRALFSEEMAAAFARLHGEAQPFAVICIDLDDFKLINDTLGHAAGDTVLKEVAERLRKHVRTNDMVARLGGDEFAILVPRFGQPADVRRLAARLIADFQLPVLIEGQDVRISASAGIAFAPNDASEPESLLRCADLALYRAKEISGGAFIAFDAEMDSRFERRRLMEMALNQALARGEFALHYQPIVAVDNGRLRGFEALLRWESTEFGTISPGEFIPLAEETGLILPIGEWVLTEACRQAASWPEELLVAVNVSASQFRTGTLTTTVEKALADAGLPSERLEIEITETVILDDSDAVLEQLNALREMGVRIALDDFGTGYASMSYLRKFTFSRIKIDRSFVKEITTSVESLAIVRAIVGLGHSLGISTTAEGVETADQLDTLRGEQCADLQGFLFSPPMPEAGIAGMISRFFKQDEPEMRQSA